MRQLLYSPVFCSQTVRCTALPLIARQSFTRSAAGSIPVFPAG